MYKAKQNLLLSLLLALSFSAKAQELNIIHTIPSPVGLSMDLAYDGTGLWVSDGLLGDSVIYKISILDGSVLKTIYISNTTARGLTFANGYLYMTDNDPLSLVHKIDTTDGVIVETYPTPTSTNIDYPTGLAWDGNSFWLIEAYSGILYQLNESFEIIQELPDKVGDFGNGLTFVNGNLWFTENINDKLFEMDTTDFEILQQFDITQGIYPNGLAFDGQYLWISISDDNGAQPDSIYQLDIGLPPLVSVDDIEDLFSLKVFPNPVDDVLYFYVLTDESYFELDLNIYNSLGQKISQHNIVRESTAISVNHLPTGIYHFTIKSKQKRIQSGHFIVETM